jgi:DNA-binding beta-propeller fold protein YncE
METRDMRTYRNRGLDRRGLRPRRVRAGLLALTAALAVAAPPVVAETSVEPTNVRAGADRSRRSPAVTDLVVVHEVPGTDELGMSRPSAVALDHRGDVVIADTGNHRVVVVGRGGELRHEFGGYGWDADRLDTPSDVCVYPGFWTYVLDEGNRRVARYDVQGDYVDLVVPEDEAGSPVSIAVGAAGGLLLVDADTQSVLSYSQFDEKLKPVGRFGADAGGLLAPSDVAAGPSREVAVADPGRGSVEVFDEFGAQLFSISTPDTLDPLDIAFDELGNVLVVDGNRNRLLAFRGGGGPHTASLDGGDDFRITAVSSGVSGELAVLDGESGRVRLVEMVYGVDAARR